MLDSFSQFLADHGLIDARSGARLERFMFCSDGPFDVRDFVVKQCYISKVRWRNIFFAIVGRVPWTISQARTQ